MKTIYIFFLLSCSLCWGMPGFYEPWGKDADIKLPVHDAFQESERFAPMVWATEKIIWFHQNIISPVDGPRSHFRPSSSGYMLEAVRKHGFITGILMGCDRLLRENNEDWIYYTVEYEGRTLKWDPPP